LHEIVFCSDLEAFLYKMAHPFYHKPELIAKIHQGIQS